MNPTLNHAGDRIVIFIAMGEVGGVQVLSRSEFLAEYPDNWRDLLHTGLSMYIGSNGRMVSYNEAEQHLNQLMS